MEQRGIFFNLSPLDHRYYLANRDLYDNLAKFLSEDAVVRYCVKVEVRLLKTLVESAEGVSVDPEVLAAIDRLPEQIPTEEIYAEEEKTRHNIRAVVNVLKKYVPSELTTWIHLGATSVDILDTAQSLRIGDAMRQVVIPLLIEVEMGLIRLTFDEADTPQIGRTHGQQAVPLTFGFAMAEYVSRLGKSIEKLVYLTGDLRGKLAGAVGAYNATNLIVLDPEELEERFLAGLGLMPSEHSTQLIEPEHQLRLLTELNTAFGVIANLADDLRNLQRSEIGEVREAFGKTQVGSSTMPQKRNPWNSEHVKSLWKAFSPRIITHFMDQISEHQRDLTNSASSRFISEYIGGVVAAANRMKKILSGLGVNRDKMMENLQSAGDMVLAEAMYIVLAVNGEPDAHELVRKQTLDAEETGESLVDRIKRNPKIWKNLETTIKKVYNLSPESFFGNPSLYTGVAARKAKKIADKYEKKMDELSSRLNE